MAIARDDAINGFNDFIKEQRGVEGEAIVTLTTFNTECNFRYSGIPIEKVDNLNKDTYYPSGGTALYDAVGATIDKVRERHKKLKEEDRPKNVIFAILTDGEENSSREYDNVQIIKSKVNQAIAENDYKFLYLAANEEKVLEEGVKMGFVKMDSNGAYAAAGPNCVCATFVPISGGTITAYSCMSNTTTSLRR
jgi:hypothetical protein